MPKKSTDKKERDPSGRNQWRPSNYEHAKPRPHKLTPDEKADAQPPVDTLHDYNLVAMSDFKQNPSAYLLRTEMVPLAISRYGRIEGMLLTVTAYNRFIENIRTLKSEVSELRQLIAQTNPDLAKLNEHRPPEVEITRNRPVWPLFNHLPARSRTGIVSEKSLSAALTEIRLLTLSLLDAQNAPKAANDETDAWQKVPEVHVMEKPEEKPIGYFWADWN